MKKHTFFLCMILSLLMLSASLVSASSIDLTKAIVIGNGPKKVIEFTDPDCPFCRKASAYFHNRTDVTRYVFFKILASHPNSRPKGQYVLSGKDKVKLYHDVMSGSLDRTDLSSLPTTEKGKKLLEDQQLMAEKAGIDSTPTFMIMGRVIEGFDLKRIEELLGK